MSSPGSEDQRSSSSKKSGSTEKSSITSSPEKKSKESRELGSTDSKENVKSRSDSPDGNKAAVNVKINDGKKKRSRSKSSGSSKSGGGVISEAAGAFATAVVKEVPKLFEKSENKNELDTRSTVTAKEDPKKSGSPLVQDDKPSKAEEDRRMNSPTEKRREKKEEKQREDQPEVRGAVSMRSKAEKQERDPVAQNAKLIPPNVQLDARVGPKSQPMYCPSCERRVRTRVMYEVTLFTHLIALILCAVCCCCISCVPYCVDSCKSRNHYCPHCGHFFGTFK